MYEFFFLATRRRRNLLAYNNSDKNEKQKNGKMKSRRRVWIMVPIVCWLYVVWEVAAAVAANFYNLIRISE